VGNGVHGLVSSPFVEPRPRFFSGHLGFVFTAPGFSRVGHVLGSEELRKNLTRTELAEVVYPYVGTSRREAAVLVDAVLGEIVEAIARGEEVKLSGFGAFSIRSKAERMGRNPRNGAPAKITSRRVVVFRPSRILKAKVADAPASGEPETEDADL
jgi:integration host factor subunit alpha